MSRTKRLLDLLLILNNRRYSVSGHVLAQELGISIRTLYRDIAILRSQGAQIEGEVGVGYVLKPSFFIPPMMFTENEVYALILGSKWVSQYGDMDLSKSANTALDKIFAVLPRDIKNIIDTISLRVGPPASQSFTQEDLTDLRLAILNKNKIEIAYLSANNDQSNRIIWPFAIGYFTDKRILVGWCEKQNDYRHFKTDRIISMRILDEHYNKPRTELFEEWQKLQLLGHISQ
jgi:predicted DNA-binding transcriptional regulator YafY